MNLKSIFCIFHHDWIESESADTGSSWLDTSHVRFCKRCYKKQRYNHYVGWYNEKYTAQDKRELALRKLKI